METRVDTVQYRGFTIDIYPDNDAEGPREWSNVGTFYITDDQYKRHYIDPDDTRFWDLIERDDLMVDDDNAAIFERVRIDNPGAMIVPVWQRSDDSLFADTKPYERGDDVDGATGFYFVSRDQLRSERLNRKQALSAMRAEVETYAQWQTGEVYYYSVQGFDATPYDSCSGFYGWDWELNGLLEYARNAIDCEINERNKQTSAAFEAMDQFAAVA